MTLTVASFDNLKQYKKDLAKTLKTCMKSKYSLVKFSIDDKVRDVIVCGKEHDELLKQLAEKQKKPLVAPGRGLYESATFHPVSGTPVTGDLLKDLAVDDIATVYRKKLADNEEIPEGGITLGEFKQLIEKAKQALGEATHPNIRGKLDQWVQSGERNLEKFDSGDYGGVPMTVMQLQRAIENQTLFVRLTKDLAHWLPIARRRTDDSAEMLLKAQDLLDKGRTEEAENAFEQAMTAFKSVKDFESSEKSPATDDPMTRRLEELVSTAAGLGDLYAKSKAALVDAIKQNATNPRMQLHAEAKVLAKVLPTLFKDELKDKLEAVHKARGQRLPVRKPLIEKALVTLRQYLKGIDEIKQKADIDGSLLIMFVGTLEHIQKELLEDYRSKDLPPNN